MMTENMTREKALEDLGTIRGFLEEGQRHLDESGFQFIFWGCLIPVATAVYAVLHGSLGYAHPVSLWFWPVVSFGGAAFTWVTASRKARSSRSQGYASTVNGLFWGGFMVSALLVSAIDWIGGVGYSPIFLSRLAILLGLAYWIHGSMLRLSWFRWFSPLWWVAALAMARMDWNSASWVMAGATFACSLVPGVILRITSRKNP